MTSDDLRRCVRGYLPADRWAVFDEVRNETGWTAGKRTRAVDMLALGLWRSRGMELHGFELKVSRGDFLRELADPTKADAIKRYCDRWWLVAPNEVLAGDLPSGWGWLRPNTVGIGRTLDVMVKAPKLTAAPLDRLFVASIARQCARRAA